MADSLFRRSFFWQRLQANPLGKVVEEYAAQGRRIKKTTELFEKQGIYGKLQPVTSHAPRFGLTSRTVFIGKPLFSRGF